MYVKIIDGEVAKYPYSANELKADNPNVSFPVELTDEMLADFNAAIVQPNPAPVVDHTKNVEEGIPAFTGAHWEQTWVVTDASAEEVAAREGNIRADNKSLRNEKLSGTDWTQLGDVPLTAQCKADFADYRQALRDLDMLDPVWPDMPQEVWQS